MKKRKKWNVFATVVIAVQTLLIVTTIILIAVVDILPTQYLFLMGAILILLLTVEYPLIYSRIRKKKDGSKKGYGKRTVGTTVAFAVITLCIFVMYYLAKLGITIWGITGDANIVKNTIGVYVLNDSTYQELSDLEGKTFGITKSYDYDNTKETITHLNSKMDSDIDTENYDTVLDMVDALYEKKVDAIILNKAYVEVLTSQTGYEDFELKTRCIYEHEIVKVIKTTKKDFNITKDPFVVYISGSDTRDQKLVTSRSDVNLLAVVNPTTREILLINTPRDTYLSIYGGSSGANGEKDKLTHCGIYGIDCSVETLEKYYNVDIPYYGQINFTGFETLIDDIGGVTVYCEKTVSTYHHGYMIYEGENTLTGAMALDYCRDRFSFAGGDFARGQHQMDVLKGIIKKCTSSTALISNYGDFMSDIEGMFTTNMSSQDISDLVKMQLADMKSWDIHTFSVTGTCGKDYMYSMQGKNDVVYVEDGMVEYVKELIQMVMNGEDVTDEDMTYTTK